MVDIASIGPGDRVRYIGDIFANRTGKEGKVLALKHSNMMVEIAVGGMTPITVYPRNIELIGDEPDFD